MSKDRTSGLTVTAVTESVTRKPLTALDALVLSPFDPPATPQALPELFDEFQRCVHALETGSILIAQAEDRVVTTSAQDRPFFALTPVLRDGTTDPRVLPAGALTRDMVAHFVSAPVELFLREPGWGVRAGIEALHDDGRFRSTYDVRLPLIDPIRDGAQAEIGETVLPLGVEFEDPWRQFFRPWEHLDGFFGLASEGSGSLWLQRRRLPAEATASRWWFELQGLRDRGDPDAYRPMWTEPRPFVAYLGWPAYLIEAAGTQGRCEFCGSRTIGRRRYCGQSACSRGRALVRKRTSRRAKGQRPR